MESQFAEATTWSEITITQAGMIPGGSTSSGYMRDRARAASVLNAAVGCFVDPSHETFTSRITRRQFLEAHHIVRVSATPRFIGHNLA
jgi:hypothetical protein